MSGSFLDFFAKLQQRQPGVPNTAEPSFQQQDPSAAARAAAAAAPPSRPAARRPQVEDGAGDNRPPSAAPPSSTRAAPPPTTTPNPQGATTPAIADTISYASIQAAASRLGPQLAGLRRDQDNDPHRSHESYSMEHVRRLEMFKPMHDYHRPRANVYCSKVHPQPCTYGCKSCHFCRQRTTEIKTVCSRCEGVNNFYGGPGRGYWCGSCLWLRIGENIEEIRQRDDWLCPGCRDVCNCSSPNCMRQKRGWFPTNQLSHEAKAQGFRSVAHYLVHTLVSATAAAAPLADNTDTGERAVMTRQRGDNGDVRTTATAELDDAPASKRQRTLSMRGSGAGGNAREQMLERASQMRLQSEVAAVLEELGSGFSGSGGNSSSGSAGNGETLSVLHQLLHAAAAAGGDNSRNSHADGQGASGSRGTSARLNTSSSSGIPGAIGAPGNFLGILDMDMLEEEDDEAAIRTTPTPSVAAGGAAGGSSGLGQHFAPAAANNRNNSTDTSPYFGLMPLPPRRPPARERRLSDTALQQQQQHPAAAGTLPPAVPGDGAAGQGGDDVLRRLVGELGNDEGVSMHRGLPGSSEAVVPRVRNSKSARGPALAIPGWGKPPSGAAAANGGQQQQQQQQGEENGRRLSPRGQPEPQPQPHVHPSGDQVILDSDKDVCRMEVDATEPQEMDFDLDALPASAPAVAAAEVGSTPPAVAAQASALEGARDEVIVINPSLEPTPAPVSPSLPPQREQLEQLEQQQPCTDAHTVIAAKVSLLSNDEFIWNELCLRASGVVHDVHALFKHHPDCPEYAGPLLGAQQDIAMYEAAYDASIEELRVVLHDAEALLSDDVAIPSSSSDSSADDHSRHPMGTLRTYAGLRKAVSLLTYLARLLPEADVRWRVERRLLGAEPFINFEKSDVRARAILLHGMLELLATLQRRNLPISDTAAAISNALATVTTDTFTALPLLNAIIASQPLPETDLCIGAWKFDAEARQKRLLELFAELSVLYASLMQVLTAGLEQITAVVNAPGVLGIKAVAFLTPDLVHALLGPGAKLPGYVKRHALALVCSICDVASPRHDALTATLHLTWDERATKAAARTALCTVVERDVIPALEAMVQKDYPLWRDPRARPSGANTAGGGLFSGLAEEPHDQQAEHVGGEKVETLAQCYAFLVSCNRLGWPAIESKATQPYSYTTFWRQANTAYRHFAIFFLAHTLAHAPDVLGMQIHATSTLKMWVQCLTDSGRRQCSWYLTTVLAANPATRFLFAGMPPEALDIRQDSSGEKRAALLGAVARNMAMGTGGRMQVAAVLGDLDAVLATRKKEVQEMSAFNREAAVLRWESSACGIIVALLRSLSHFLPLNAPAANNHNQNKDFATSQLRRLLYRVATWTISSCAMAHKEYLDSRNTSNQAAADVDIVETGGGGGVHGDDLRTLADARQRLQGTAFSKLSSVFDILIAATGGNPNHLDTDTELLEILWVVIASCIEMASGEVEPTPVDTAMFEMLGDSLAPTIDADNTSHVVALVSSAEARSQMCIYVLATFVRRYLQRSSLKHITNARAAVNTIRLIRAVLTQPSMRNTSALHKALAVLLRPLLSVLNPDGSAGASAGVGASQPCLGATALIYQVLAELLQMHPSLLPPLENPAAASSLGTNFQGALHAFWMAVCQDVLSCVAARLPTEMVEQRLRAAQLNSRSNNSAKFIWPTTAQSVAQASNTLMTCLGRPRNIEALEKIYSRPGGAHALPLVGSGGGSGSGVAHGPPNNIPGGHGNALHSAQGGQQHGVAVLFRAGDFPWKAAESAIDLLRTMAAMKSSSQEQDQGQIGPLWAMACFPALHHLVPGTASASKLLHGAYRSLRSVLEDALGPDCTAPYPLAAPKPPAVAAGAGEALPGNAPAAAAASGAEAAAQEQCQPNTAPSVISRAAEIAPTGMTPHPSTVPYQPQPSRPTYRTISVDQTLAALGALPIETRSPLTALVQSVKTIGSKGAICVVKDFSGRGGSAACAKLAVSGSVSPAAMATMIGLRIESSTAFPIVRFSQVRVSKPADQQFVAGLTVLESTVVQLEPQGPMADALRRRSGSGRGTQHHDDHHQYTTNAVSQEAECPVRLPLHQLESQSTQPGAGTGVAIKSEPKSKSDLQQQHHNLDGGALQAAHVMLMEMGYSSEAARAAVLKVMQERGNEWKKMSVAQLANAAVQKLL